MKKIFKLLSIFVIALLFTACSQSKVNVAQNANLDKPASEKTIREFFQRSNVIKSSEKMMNLMIKNFKKMTPHMDDELWDVLKSKIDMEELIKSIIPIYQKYYTEGDMLALNEFYKSKAGQKFAANEGKVMKESFEAGQAWGRQMAIEVLKEISKMKKIKKGKF